MKRYLIDPEYDKYGDAPILCDFHSLGFNLFEQSIENGQPYLGGTLDFFYFDIDAFDYDWFKINPLQGIVITERLFNLFTTQKLKGVNFYPAQIRTRNGQSKTDYYFMHSIVDYTKLIDYKKTDFVCKRFGVMETLTFELSDNSTLESIKFEKKKFRSDPFNKIWPRDKFHFLDEACIDEYDLVCLNYFNPYNYYVSDTLKKEMERLPVRGVSFLETEHL